MTDAEQVAAWRQEIDAAIQANAHVCNDDPDWNAVATLESIAALACDMVERLLAEVASWERSDAYEHGGGTVKNLEPAPEK